MPHCFPFQYRNRSTAHETVFPNTGNPLSILIRTNSSYRHVFAIEDDNSTLEFKIAITGMKLVLAVPRFSQDGYQLIRDKNLPPLRFDGPFVKQYAQSVNVENTTEVSLVLQKIPLPNYLLIQHYDQFYFTGAPKNDFVISKFPSVAKPFPLKYLKMRYGNRDLSYQTANFDVEKEGSDKLRQDILKHSDVFGCSEMDQEYYHPILPSEIEKYQHPHYLFSFCSDEKTQTILRPMDYVDRKDVPNNLTINLIANSADPFPVGKFIMTLIYTKSGISYSTKTGAFLERDLNALLLSS